MNIISLICTNAGIQGIYINEQYKKELAYKYARNCTSEKYKRALTSLLKGNSRDSQGAWKDVALDGRLGIHATAAPL